MAVRVASLMRNNDVGLDLRGYVERFGAAGSSADELHVRLEREQLGDVIARLGDVVDDEYADAV